MAGELAANLALLSLMNEDNAILRRLQAEVEDNKPPIERLRRNLLAAERSFVEKTGKPLTFEGEISDKNGREEQDALRQAQAEYEAAVRTTTELRRRLDYNIRNLAQRAVQHHLAVDYDDLPDKPAFKPYELVQSPAPKASKIDDATYSDIDTNQAGQQVGEKNERRKKQAGTKVGQKKSQQIIEDDTEDSDDDQPDVIAARGTEKQEKQKMAAYKRGLAAKKAPKEASKEAPPKKGQKTVSERRPKPAAAGAGAAAQVDDDDKLEEDTEVDEGGVDLDSNNDDNANDGDDDHDEAEDDDDDSTSDDNDDDNNKPKPAMSEKQKGKQKVEDAEAVGNERRRSTRNRPAAEDDEQTNHETNEAPEADAEALTTEQRLQRAFNNQHQLIECPCIIVTDSSDVTRRYKRLKCPICHGNFSRGARSFMKGASGLRGHMHVHKNEVEFGRYQALDRRQLADHADAIDWLTEAEVLRIIDGIDQVEQSNLQDNSFGADGQRLPVTVAGEGSRGGKKKKKKKKGGKRKQDDLSQDESEGSDDDAPPPSKKSRKK